MFFIAIWFFFFLSTYLLFGFMGVLGAACEICFPVQRLNPGPLHCQCRVLATGTFPGILFVCFVWGGVFVCVCVCVCVCVFVFVLAKVEKRKGKKLCKQVWYWEWVNLLIVLPEDMQFTKTLCLYSIIYSKEEMVNCK